MTTIDDHNRNPAWSYDADGRLISMNEPPPDELTFVPTVHTYDAAGRHVKHTQTTSRVTQLPGNPVHTTLTTIDAVYDGDGQQVKRIETTQINSQQPTSSTNYYLRSSVLGQIITEYDAQGQRYKSHVYGGEALITSTVGAGLLWRYNNPVTGDGRETDTQGKLINASYLDPEGVDVGASDPADNHGEPPPPEPLPKAGAYAAYLPRSLGGSGRCRLDGFEIGCGWIASLESTGLVAPGATPSNVAPIYSRSRRQYVGFAVYNREAAARGIAMFGGSSLGYLPAGYNVSGATSVWESAWTPGSSVYQWVCCDDEGRLYPQPTAYSGSEYFRTVPQNTTFDVPGITNLVNQELADPDCAKFASTILNQLSKGKGGSLADVFKAFLNQPKPHDLYTRTAPPGSRGEATAIGSLKNSTAAIFTRKDPNQTVHDADGTIAELFHFAGGSYSDEQLARALRNTEYATEASKAFPDGTANIFDKRYFPGDKPGHIWSKADGFSTYFHAIAKRHCGLGSPNTYRNVR